MSESVKFMMILFGIATAELLQIELYQDVLFRVESHNDSTHCAGFATPQRLVKKPKVVILSTCACDQVLLLQAAAQ